jgi:dTDP-4-amino-4,6-dideoxygalactose transaminase
MVEMGPLLELAEKYELRVIEDAAQSIGAEYSWKGRLHRAGSGGDTGILSFFPSKNLGGAGDGGMVLTSNLNLREKIVFLRNQGAQQRYLHTLLGGNFRLDEIQAAVLRIKLKYLPEWIRIRQQKAENYGRLFREMGLIEGEFVTIPPAVHKPSGVENYHTYNQYVIRVKQRDELREFLLEKGIQTAIYYPIPLHLQPCFRYLGYQKGDFPQAERASAEVLALPIYPEIPESHQEYVVATIREFFLG